MNAVSAWSPSLRVGISIADSPGSELVRLGLSSLHLRHAFIELVRHVLAAGWMVAYGGDLRTGGFTEALFDLVRTYDPNNLPGPERVTNYLAWPIWTQVDVESRAAIANLARLVEIPAPEGAPDSLKAPAARDGNERFWAAQALTLMRERMTTEIDARIVMGGPTSGQGGLLPGIVEEADLALAAGVPVFAIGGFAGAGRVVVDALTGEEPEALTEAFQIQNTAGYEQLLSAARALDRGPDFRALVARFRGAGFSGLRNGLDLKDAQVLAGTDDIDEIVALSLRGLRRIASPPQQTQRPGQKSAGEEARP